MAAIFQIRRGSGSVSLTDGELYLHKASGSVQFSLGDGNPILLARLDQINSGSLKLSGDVTASNAYFSGDVAISGNLYLGNASTDNISALGQFTTNLVPNPNNTIDVGTPSAIWKTMYASTFSGSLEGNILGLGNPTQFSASVDDRLDQLQLASASLQSFTSSQETKNTVIESYTASMNVFTSSQEAKDIIISAYTASMNLFTASIHQHSESINLFTSSQEAKDIIISAYTASMNLFTASIHQHSESINLFTSSQEAKDIIISAYTASMNSFTSSTNVRLNEIELYTSSLKSAIDVTGGNTRILGNLIVDGTQTSLNTTETFVEDKSITLASGSTTSAIADGAGLNIAGANVSMSWEDSNQRLYFNTTIAALGSISSSTVVGLNGDSVTVYSTSVDSRLLNLQLTSASLNTKNDTLEIYTASLNNKHNTLELYTASLELYTASVNSDLASIHQTTSSLNQFTASIAGTNEFTASTKIRLDNLENTSASISSSVGQLNSVTASLHSYTSSTNIRLDNIELTTSSLNSSIVQINSVTTSLNTWSGGIDTKFTTLETYTGSLNSSIVQINLVTASLNSWTGSGFFDAYSTSVDSLLDELRYDLDLLTPAGLSAAFDNLNLFTASANVRLNNIELTTSSINTKFTTLENLTGSYETNGRGIVSGSSQITPLLPTGVISGSSQIALILPAGTVSGSSQVDITATTNYTTFSSSIANDITSLNLYTSSLKGAITISGTDVSIAGGLTVLGTTTIIDSTTLNIKDNIIQLNGAGAANAGIVVRDATGTTTSGSLLWDTTNDRWIAGPLGSEAKVLTDGMGVISGSGQLGNYETTGRGIVSGSSQITFSGISSLPTLVSGSSQIAFSGITGTVSNLQLANSSISGVSLGGNLATLTIGTGLSGTSYNGSSLVTIANAGVTSNVAGTGITVSGATGAVTISIGQEVATTSNVQFGSLGIGTTASGVSGEIRATGDITAFFSSDIRLKENIQPIQNALEKVESISGNTYDWKEGYEELHSHKGNDVGVIAQEIEEILPQIVTNRDNGFKAVQYEKIIPLLIEAIKELSDKVKVLENK
jgi:hypothetical protein